MIYVNMLFFDTLVKKGCLQDCVFIVIFNQRQTQVNKLFNTNVQLKIISESLLLDKWNK